MNIEINKKFWKNKKVFITGHTGFKGSWLSIYLTYLGAEVTGYSLKPNTYPNLFNLAKVNNLIKKSIIADIREYKKLYNEIKKSKASIIFHLAAQPLVRLSYIHPKDTFDVNFIGTLNILQIIKKLKNISTGIIITTDKVYDIKKNKIFRETDSLGGLDPYSSSKVCVEYLFNSYNESFFKNHKQMIATVRAGNVIGGGDYSLDRLIPDIYKSSLLKKNIMLRNPDSIRPWQHVLDPLSGYLLLAQNIHKNKIKKIQQNWNFGPNISSCKSVRYLTNFFCKYLKIKFSIEKKNKNKFKPETSVLRLSNHKAKKFLNWHPRWSINKSLAKIIEWNKMIVNEDKIKKFIKENLPFHKKEKFIPGKTLIPPSGKLIGIEEIKNMISASLDGWLTTGRFNSEFEISLANFLNVKHLITVNSGSSANLIAFSSLTSHLHKEKAINPGDEIISVAAGFPTTVNPIFQNGAIPVFVDIKLPTYNINENLIEEAISNKTKAIMLAHTLGNPFNLNKVVKICKKYNLWLIEDNCDALGTKYKNQFTGTFGDVATLSFYPAHHITMGEGGAVFTNNFRIKRIAESFRDWGRDCYCEPGKENTCGKRFDWKLGQLPQGYDHKYIYSHLGFNMKITDMQAACGLGQLKNLEFFIKKRKQNLEFLKKQLLEIQDDVILPEAEPNSDPSWFGFPITIKENSNLKRKDIINKLTEEKIGTRLLFAGNLTKQPAYLKKNFRVSGSLSKTDLIMNNTFWVGIQPSLGEEELSYVGKKILEIFKS